MEKNLPHLFDQTIKLAGAQTPTGKALLRARGALKRGQPMAVKNNLYKAFDTLPPVLTNQVAQMTGSEKQAVENTLVDLFQRNQSGNQRQQQAVDNLIDQSYQEIQKNNSRAGGVIY